MHWPVHNTGLKQSNGVETLWKGSKWKAMLPKRTYGNLVFTHGRNPLTTLTKVVTPVDKFLKQASWNFVDESLLARSTWERTACSLRNNPLVEEYLTRNAIALLAQTNVRTWLTYFKCVVERKTTVVRHKWVFKRNKFKKNNFTVKNIFVKPNIVAISNGQKLVLVLDSSIVEVSRNLSLAEKDKQE